MRRIFQTSLMLVVILSSCSKPNTYEVVFCNELDNGTCVDRDTVFNYGQTVYIQFEASQPLEYDSIVGSIYGLVPNQEPDRFKFASKIFAPVKNQLRVEHNIPFGQFGSIGNYEIEFTDMNDNVLGSGLMRIKRPD